MQASSGGCCGYGDCAPLPEAGTETSIAAEKRLSTWLRDHNRSTVETQLAVLERQIPSPTPAADAALETALLDLSARLCGLTLSASLVSEQRVERARDLEPKPALAREPDLKSGRDRNRNRDREQALKPGLAIEVNAALGAVATLQPEQIGQALAAGFRVLKIKVGVAPIERELEAIQNLCCAATR